MRQQLNRTIRLKLLRFVLKPVVAFCVRHALHIQDLIECAKELFVSVASQELVARQERVQDSKLSVMSGVHRRDIARLRKGGAKPDFYEKDLVSKVVGLWQTHARFRTSEGAPRVLSVGAGDSDFAKLVELVSTDIKPGAVLFELDRAGAIEVRAKGVALVKGSYAPKGDADQGFSILAADMGDIIKSVESNVLRAAQPPQLHARTQYDNVRPAAVEELKNWLLREGHALHLKAREIISQHDQDVNPDANFSGKGVRVVLGSYSLVEQTDDVES